MTLSQSEARAQRNVRAARLLLITLAEKMKAYAVEENLCASYEEWVDEAIREFKTNYEASFDYSLLAADSVELVGRPSSSLSLRYSRSLAADSVADMFTTKAKRDSFVRYRITASARITVEYDDDCVAFCLEQKISQEGVYEIPLDAVDEDIEGTNTVSLDSLQGSWRKEGYDLQEWASSVDAVSSGDIDYTVSEITLELEKVTT